MGKPEDKSWGKKKKIYFWFWLKKKKCNSFKRNELSSHEKTGRKQMHMTKRKKPIQKGYMLYDSNYMTDIL